MPDPPVNGTVLGTPENDGVPRLRLEAVSTFYGEAQVLKGISLTARARQIVAILGSNGAGKTTLLEDPHRTADSPVRQDPF